MICMLPVTLSLTVFPVNHHSFVSEPSYQRCMRGGACAVVRVRVRVRVRWRARLWYGPVTVEVSGLKVWLR